MLKRSLLVITANSVLWFVIMVKFGHPKTNNFALSNAQVIARNSLSLGEYRVLPETVNREPAKTGLQTLGQLVGINSEEQLQHFRRRYFTYPFFATVIL